MLSLGRGGGVAGVVEADEEGEARRVPVAEADFGDCLRLREDQVQHRGAGRPVCRVLVCGRREEEEECNATGAGPGQQVLQVAVN